MADVLGLDIGGVVMDGVKEDRSRMLNPPAVAGAFAAIARLRRERFLAGCWLVSRCNPEAETEILDWLERHRFFQISGVDRQHVVFCRAPSDKAGICRNLDVTHFVDDRLAVLKHMIGVVPNLYRFLSRASRLETAEDSIQGIRTFHTWVEVTDALLDSRRVLGRPNNSGPKA